jgi:hypothetical protein
LTAPLLDDISNDDTSTAWKALAGIPLSWLMTTSGHRLSAVPWKNHGEPLSASTMPCFFIALMTVTVRASSPAVG